MCRWLGSVLGPLVTTETRLLFTCRLLGPLLNRLTAEKPKLLLEVTSWSVVMVILPTPAQVVLEIYKMLQRVDKEQAGHMTHSDLLCDYLYPNIVQIMFLHHTFLHHAFLHHTFLHHTFYQIPYQVHAYWRLG